MSYTESRHVTDLKGSDMRPARAEESLLASGPPPQRRRRRFGAGAAGCALAGGIAIAAALSGCAPTPTTPMVRPVEAMDAPWGPFARQCDSTRVAHSATRWRLGETEITDVYETCVGFSVMPAGRDAAEITASVGKVNQPLSSVVLRILRNTNGVARPAAPGDDGLLAQGSDVADGAETLARDIGLTARQVVSPNDTLAIPVRLSLPFPLDVVLSCRPDGGHRNHGRDTLLFSCTLDQQFHTTHLDAQLQLAGVEEIDVETGVRISSVLSGRLSGRKRPGDGAAWQPANERLLYSRDTEFE